MDQLTNKIKKVASNSPKVRKFRPWVKVAAGVVLVGSMAGAYKLIGSTKFTSRIYVSYR